MGFLTTNKPLNTNGLLNTLSEETFGSTSLVVDARVVEDLAVPISKVVSCLRIRNISHIEASFSLLLFLMKTSAVLRRMEAFPFDRKLPLFCVAFSTGGGKSTVEFRHTSSLTSWVEKKGDTICMELLTSIPRPVYQSGLFAPSRNSTEKLQPCGKTDLFLLAGALRELSATLQSTSQK